MKLYFLPRAPSPNRVRLYIAEKNAETLVVQVEEVSLAGGRHKEPSHLARNALGKVPVLQLEDGTCIHESLAIVEYLEELFPDPAMFGTTPLERARTRATERVAEIRVFYPLGRYVQAVVTQHTRFPDPVIAAHYRSQLPTGLSFLSRQLEAGGPFLMGPKPTMADCTLAATLEFARTNGIHVLDEYKALDAWFERYRTRTVYQSVFNT
ncbi:MAG: glutathione S-transferase family protein [Alphaproteobacteria bacterium]|nr:MAG: glutathione S-transferase family protein [Alphaproteobacteria bacterium]